MEENKQTAEVSTEENTKTTEEVKPDEKKQPSKAKGCAGCLLIVIIAILLAVGACKLFSDTPEEAFAKTTGVTAEQSKTAIALLHDAGVQYDGPVNVEDKAQKTYYVVDKTYGKTVFNVVDGKIITARGPQGIKYIANGAVKYQISDVSLTTQEKVEFEIAAKDEVKKRLKAPSTADFSDVIVAKEKGTVKAFGKVDAQNSFGAKVRSGFIVLFDASTKAVKDVVIM